MSREKEKGYKGKRQFSDKLQPVMQINRIVVERQRRIRKINRSKLSRKIGSKETRERERISHRCSRRSRNDKELPKKSKKNMLLTFWGSSEALGKFPMNERIKIKTG
jgi:hypothetical protein